MQIRALSCFMLEGYNHQAQSTEALEFVQVPSSCLIDSNVIHSVEHKQEQHCLWVVLYNQYC